VDRTSNGTGTIGELTFEQVRSLDFGSWKSAAYAGEQIPTFEEFIALCKRIGMHPYIELKGVPSQEQVNGLVATVKTYGMLRNVTWITASSGAVGPLVKNADAKARIGCVGAELNQALIDIAAGLKTEDNEVFVNVYSGFTQELVAQCAQKDIPLETWNGEDVVATLDAWPYISGISTDVVVASQALYQAAQ
jgi:glycerophosphoryl diester phosphodiesterase